MTFMIVILLWCIASSLTFWIVEGDAWRLAQERDANVAPLTLGRAVYFTAMNVTTVGFGDVVPRTALGEVLAVINGLAGLVLFGFLVAATTAALQPASFDADPARMDEGPQGMTRSDHEKSDAAEDLLDAVARLLAPPHPNTDDRDGVVLEVGVDQNLSKVTTIHVLVSLNHAGSQPQP